MFIAGRLLSNLPSPRYQPTNHPHANAALRSSPGAKGLGSDLLSRGMAKLGLGGCCLPVSTSASRVAFRNSSCTPVSSPLSPTTLLAFSSFLAKEGDQIEVDLRRPGQVKENPVHNQAEIKQRLVCRLSYFAKTGPVHTYSRVLSKLSHGSFVNIADC